MNHPEIEAPYPGKLKSWFITQGSFVRENQPLCLILKENSRYKIFKSPSRGVVASISKKKGSIFNKFDILVTLREPQQIEAKPFEQHDNCLTDNYHESLHKLFLVLDLDHTILHTGKEPGFISILPVTSMNIVRFSSGTDDTKLGSHCIKFRPYVFSFLNSLKPFFELAVYTMGSRDYAKHIAENIDSSKELFKGRIVSRDDCSNARVKRMENLLHCDDSTICIVDDSDDIWEEKECVLKIQKYIFWPGEKGSMESEHSIIPINYLKKRPNIDPDDFSWDDTDNDSVLVSFKNILKSIYALYFLNLSMRAKLESPSNDSSFNNLGKGGNYLQPADTRYIIAQIRKSVLRGCTIYFVDCFRNNCNHSSQAIWLLSESFGAKCERSLNDNVTHIVVGGMREEANKDYLEAHISLANDYKGQGKEVVSETWIYDAAVHFRKPKYDRHKVGVVNKDITDNLDDPVHYSDIIKRVFEMDFRYKYI